MVSSPLSEWLLETDNVFIRLQKIYMYLVFCFGDRKHLKLWSLIQHRLHFAHPRQQGYLLDTDIWLPMESWFLLSETFSRLLYRNHNPPIYQNNGKWEKTITTTFKSMFGVVCIREYFVNMTKLHHLTKLHRHMLYHVSGVVVRWRRTVLRRRRTFHTVLRRRRTQVLPWRASTYDVVRRRRTRYIVVGLCNGRCLSQDCLGQRRTGPTTAYVDVRRRRTLRESWVQS